jgi:uncharacterized delta-60 repeat protein
MLFRLSYYNADLPLVSFQPQELVAEESGLHSASFLITRSEPITSALSVGLNVAGTATPGEDYAALPTTVVIPAGQSSTRVVVAPFNDAWAEQAETIMVTLSNASADYNISTADKLTVYLNDDDSSSPLISSGFSLPPAAQDSPYNYAFNGSCGAAPYSWSLDTGNMLPAGLTLSGDGVLSGTPTVTGNFGFMVKLVDNLGRSNIKAFRLILNPPGALPEIVVEQPAGTNLTDCSSSVAFGSRLVGQQSAAFTFTVRNTGTAALTGLTVTKDGTDSSDFAVGSLGATTLAAGASKTFAVTFTPGAAGPRGAALHIASNDFDENPFDISLAGTGINSTVPDIAVEYPPGNDLTDGVSSINFGTVEQGASSGTFIISIRNYGIASLTGIAVIKDGAQAADFTVGSLGTTTLAPGASTTLPVTFSPGAAGLRSAAIHIGSNDPDENPFDIDLIGTGSAFAIAVDLPGLTVTHGGQANWFGQAVTAHDGVDAAQSGDVGDSQSSSFSIPASGPGTVSFWWKVSSESGYDYLRFYIDGVEQSGMISGTVDWVQKTYTLGDGVHTLEWRYTKDSIISAGSDCGWVDQVVVPAALVGPEIGVQQPGGLYLVDGGSAGFGSVNLGASSGTRIFTVRNTGTTNTLTGLTLTKDGTNAADYAVGSLGATDLAPGASTTFSVTFTPGATGSRAAAIHIASNDPDENPFDISLTGTGVAPEIAVEQPAGTNLTDGSASVAFGNVVAGGSSAVFTFTIKNPGSADLTGLAVTKDGGNPADFLVGTLGATTLAAGASTTFTVTFAPSALGPRSAAIHIASNDADENPFDINLTGSGTATPPEIAIEQPAGTNLLDGSASVDFGSINMGTSSSAFTFTIRNTGAADLTGLSVTKNGTNSAEFSVGTLGAATLTAGASTTFTVTFSPVAEGLRTAAIHVASNDADENPFDINLMGTGTPGAPGVADAFNPGVGYGSYNTVSALAVQADGKFLIGGVFTYVGGVSRNYIARLNADGTLDAGFNPNANSLLYTVTEQADGKILIGGTFTTVGGFTRNRIARLNPDGTLDVGFNPDANNWVNSLAVMGGGKILIGGDFTTVGGVARNRIARLNPDGTLDADFNPNANGSVYSIGVLADGKLLIGGDFTTVAGVTRNRIARLNPDGTLDADFNPNASDWARSLAVQPDGKVLVGGAFTTIGGVSRNRIARLNANGTLDTAFNPNANNSISSLALQADGRILVGGLFTTVGGVSRNRIARLNTDGTLDAAYNLATNDQVRGLALLADGKILVGGYFTNVGVTARYYIARLYNDPATATLSVTAPASVLWSRGGAAPEVGGVAFDLSTDGGLNWSSLGAGVRVDVSADWQLTGLALPASGWLRVRGRVSSGQYNGSSSLIQQIAFFGPPVPEIAVEQPAGNHLGDGISSVDIGSVNLGDSSASFTFTVKNLGTALLTGLALAKNGSNAADFSLGGLGATSLAAEASTTFTVTFSPSATGSRSAAIHIASNDADENPFDITLTGTGVVPAVSVAVAPASVAEDGTANLVYTLTRTGAITGPLTAGFAVGGTAMFSTDYGQSGAASFGASSGTVTFAAGSSTANVTLDPVSDTIIENDETVILTVTGGSGYTVGTPNSTTGTITNDDTAYSSWAAVLPADQRAPGQTPQNDGVTNLAKFAFNLNPLAPDVSKLTVGANGTTGLPGGAMVAGKLRLEFIRRKASTNPGITYMPQFSSSLGSWENFTGTETVSGFSPVSTTWERVVVEDPLGGAHRFGRLKIQSP